MTHSIEIEKSIISALLYSPGHIRHCMSHIIPEAFHIKDYRKIYIKMTDIAEKGITCDYDTMAAIYKADDDKINGEYLMDLMFVKDKTVHMESWCAALMELYVRRVIFREGQTLSGISEETQNVEENTRKSLKRISDALEVAKYKVARETKEVLKESIKYVYEVNSEPVKFIVPYCIPGFDKEIRHCRKQIHILVAPANTGKTGFALSVLEAQIANGINHVIFCQETPRVQLMNRIIAMRSNLNSSDLYDVNSNSGSMMRFKNAVDDLQQQAERFRIYGAGDYSHSTEGIYSALIAMIDAGFKPDMVTVDYIQNLKPSTILARAQRTEQLESIVMDLSRIFKELDIAGLWLSQVNRDKNRDHLGKDFINADIKGSSAIEQEADFITFIKRIRPADERGKTGMSWTSTKMRDDHMIKQELVFNIGNGKFLEVSDRFNKEMY